MNMNDLAKHTDITKLEVHRTFGMSTKVTEFYNKEAIELFNGIDDKVCTFDYFNDGYSVIVDFNKLKTTEDIKEAEDIFNRAVELQEYNADNQYSNHIINIGMITVILIIICLNLMIKFGVCSVAIVPIAFMVGCLIKHLIRNIYE